MANEEQLLRWKYLAHLLERSERSGLRSLTIEEVRNLGRFYRQVAIDLSRARASGEHPDEIRYLNNLAARAHGQIYRTRQVNLRPVWMFLFTGFPQVIRRHAVPVLIACAVFYGSALASFAAVVRDPMLAYSLFDEGMVEFERIRLEKQQGEYKGNFTFDVNWSPLAAAGIIANNVILALRIFAFGALLALPCLAILVFNGRMLGTLEGLTYNAGYCTDFNALVLTHGVLELTAFCVSGGGGLMLGWALIAPGALPRREALKRAAGDAFGLLAGCCAMLVVAGIIEAYVTPHFPQPVRWSVAGGSAVFMMAYFVLVGRQRPIANAA